MPRKTWPAAKVAHGGPDSLVWICFPLPLTPDRLLEDVDAAFCNAVRVTLVGSRIPIAIMSPYSPVAAL